MPLVPPGAERCPVPAFLLHVVSTHHGRNSAEPRACRGREVSRPVCRPRVPESIGVRPWPVSRVRRSMAYSVNHTPPFSAIVILLSACCPHSRSNRVYIPAPLCMQALPVGCSWLLPLAMWRTVALVSRALCLPECIYCKTPSSNTYTQTLGPLSGLWP